MKRILLAITLVVFTALLVDARWRQIDPDELEHLHAACAVLWDQVPYRDFFEHHTPGLYYLLQPVLWATGADVPALWAGRLLMGILALTTLLLAGLIARRVAGRLAAWVAPALLASTTVFFGKAIEVRPDVPAALLLTLAAYTRLSAPRWKPWLTAFVVGLLLGAATLFTQKAIVPAAAMIAAQLLLPTRDGRPAWWLRSVVWTALGLALPWVLAAIMFWTVGGAEALWQSTIVQLWRWPVRHSPLSSLRPTLLADIPIWLGMAVAIGRAFGKQRRREVMFLTLTVALCFLGGLVIQAAYSQYYLLWFPLAAVVAADAFVHLGSGAVTTRFRWAFIAVLAVAAVVETVSAARAIHLGQAGSLPNLSAACSVFSIAASSAIALAVLAGGAIVCLLRGRRGGAVLCLVALAFGHAALRNIDACCSSNREQLSAIVRVNQEVGPNETVLDGFTGFGVFRPHAYYYWWLNRYSLQLMEASARGPNLLAALERSPPKIVCVDENVMTLPQPVLDWIANHYAPLVPPVPPIYERCDESFPADATSSSIH